MCGRYTLTNADPDRLRGRFGISKRERIDVPPRYNVAPTDPVLAVRGEHAGERDAGMLRWGLLPGRWAQGKGGRPLINARAETLLTQPAFADSFRARRCLIPADGFYEWRRDEAGRVPFWITRADGGLFAFAGIWAELAGRNGEDGVTSCAIITSRPNDVVRPIHDRMPVILPPEAEDAWLVADADPEELLELLVPIASVELRAQPVGDAVNTVAEDGPHLVEPRAETARLF
jgi:putative SOS response-associated peptidase YedK